MKHLNLKGAGLALVLSALVACDRSPGTDGATDGVAGTAAPAPAGPPPGDVPAPVTPVELEDVSVTTADYIIGITYPQSADQYPALAADLKAYADAARAELMQAVEARSQREPAGEGSEGSTLYDLSLSFTELADGPNVVAYAADGSMYTGGAHGMPLMERFVWLPGTQERLTADTLVAGEAGWANIAAYAREQLHTELSQRADAGGLDPAQRSELVRTTGRMIDAGTEPKPSNFADFEPVVDDAGRITALRFVFAPYQVGPYSDGMHAVEIPAAVLRPHVAPAYRELFSTAPAPSSVAGAPTDSTQ
ncbi:DUF3298 and DUF4163 domain-containing protein [Novilysobacter arseniciresistens]|uniref:DUF3298 and DUF4163 domain-containing protein n=1 Tax=Novilysobacter arseniciresistens TaxID=1385522 RepID=UPI00126A1910|nr:DUF3298 and DUF4163 domain-containing protein [Lysobacter arseniciresistens]